MSIFLGCCSQDFVDKENTEENIESQNKLSGKEKILKLNYKEKFPENIKYFKISEDKNIYEKETSHDIFNLKLTNKILDLSDSCIFCGGNNCYSENYKEEKEYAIKGLISELFCDYIIVSQRPNTSLIQKYNIINSFKLNNIKLIINCQIQGEHPKCGPIKGLESDSGFTYSPSCFIEEGIDYLNCGFQEGDCPPTLDFMLEIIKKISYIIQYKKSKVFVHGHSPDGRCCLIVICFMIFYFNKTADQAIKEIKKKRKNAINNKTQIEYCEKFENYIKLLKTVFRRKAISVDKFIKYQNDISFGLNEKEKLYILSNFFKDNNINEDELPEIININFIPKILVKCLDKIIFLKNKLKIKNDEFYQLLNEKKIISQNEYNQIILIKKELNNNIWDLFNKNPNLLIFIEILFSWIKENVNSIINPEKIKQLFNKSLNSNLNIDEIFNGNYQLNFNEMVDIIHIFKDIFSKGEYETIKYISIFITLIYPQIKSEKHFNSQEIDEFKKLLFKLSFLLLGYNLDINNSPCMEDNSKESIIAKKFILIIEFFIFFKCDEKKSKNINNNCIWFNDYLNLKKKFEEKIYSDEDDILLFIDLKPKINFKSIKSYF